MPYSTKGAKGGSYKKYREEENCAEERLRRQRRRKGRLQEQRLRKRKMAKIKMAEKNDCANMVMVNPWTNQPSQIVNVSMRYAIQSGGHVAGMENGL